MLLSLDLETECAVPTCEDSQCSHALIPHLSRITVIGIWSPETKAVFRDDPNDPFGEHSAVSKLVRWVPKGAQFVGHNLKFDLKHLAHPRKGYDFWIVPEEMYKHDTSLMAVASPKKVSAEYLEWYEAKRKEENKKLKKGFSHREASQHSLKTLAPYFLGVSPFWETPESHDNDEYVLKDAEYTYRLMEYLYPKLHDQGVYDFYKYKLMNWQKMFMRAEMRGIQLDMKKVETGAQEATRLAAEYKDQLDQEWKSALPAFREAAKIQLQKKYKRSETVDKHLPTEINLASPVQLKWLLKDHLGLDIKDINGKESTDAEVLERIALSGRSDVALLLKYREQTKLATTYYPSYKELSNEGVLHGNFHLTTARTGRTSSSNPNLQNQPGALHELFIARPGYKLLTKDLAAIEPALVAYFSEDPLLVDLIQNSGDFHSRNANVLFQENWTPAECKKEHKAERDMAKEAGLAVLYGAGARRIQACAIKRGFDWSIGRCQEAVYALKDAWPDVIQFKEELDALAAQGKPIENLFGRKRIFDDPSEIHLKNFNGIIQGSASDLLLHSVYRATQKFKELKIDAHLLMVIHDECVFEVPNDQIDKCDEIITRCMTDYKLETKMGLVPLRVEGKVSDCWEK